MQAEQEGKILKIIGGHGIINKLEALGVRIGKKIKKINSAKRGGPLVFEIDNTQIAIGKGIAKKILINPNFKV
jgi:ferrous iron transport protein A